MDRQPVLEGERLHLRPLAASDWPALWAIASDKQLWAKHPANDRWQEPVFRKFFDEALANGGALAVIDKAGGEVIGSSRYERYDPATGGSVEIGWTFLARRVWGSGLNAELKRLMLGHALRSVERVDFRVGKDNIISRKAMTKIGGRLSDRHEQFEYNGRTLEYVIFEITRDEFANGPLARV